MKRSHLVPCGLGIALAVVLLLAVGVNSSTLLFLGVVLACPVMMFTMMKMMMPTNGNTKARDDTPSSDSEQPHPTSHT